MNGGSVPAAQPGRDFLRGRLARGHLPRRPACCRSRPRSRSGSPRPARACSFSTTRARMVSATARPASGARPSARRTSRRRRVLVERGQRERARSSRAESDLNRCAPPYTVCTGCRSPVSPGYARATARLVLRRPAQNRREVARTQRRNAGSNASCGWHGKTRRCQRLRTSIGRVAERAEQQRHVVVRLRRVVGTSNMMMTDG